MPVAKSFQKLEQIDMPFEVGGKMYIYVKNPTTGTARRVRWYSDAEYMKLYPGDTEFKSTSKYHRSQKSVLGFDGGYITLCVGAEYEQCEWFKSHGARYTRDWGWYFMSETPIPEDIPENITLKQLDWELVGTEQETLKPDAEIQKALESILYDPGVSEYQGEVGEKLEVYVTVEAAIALDGYYGRSTMFIMHDDCGNIYVWNTATKDWAVETEHHIIGTVKEHKTYKNVKQTVLTRCKEVE